MYKWILFFKVTTIISLVFNSYFSIAQRKNKLENSSMQEGTFVCATGFYSFKVIDGKIITMQTGYPGTDKTLINLPVLVEIENFENVKSIASGANHLMILTTEGKVYTWGSNKSGQLGYRSTAMENTFLPVVRLPKIKEISCGTFHCIALDYNGNVYSWGNNKSGQLGDGTNINRFTPYKIKRLKNITSIVAGMHHNLVLDGDSLIWTWGNNSNGQLGNGTYENSSNPVRLNRLTSIIQIKASAASYALTSDGALWSWGYNGHGQLGNRVNLQNSNLPSVVSLLPPIATIECGFGHCVSLDYDGNIWTWGYNSCGQLGDGSLDSRNFPLKVFSDCMAISAGSYHNLFLGSDSTIYSTGIISNSDFSGEYTSELSYVFALEKLDSKEDAIEIIILSE